jgi:hypothetical protein
MEIKSMKKQKLSDVERRFRRAQSYRKYAPSHLHKKQEYRRLLKLEVLKAYGEVCQCCGESIQVFLTIDHINNDGAIHRKQIGYGGSQFYSWLRLQGFPSGYQVLCRNCNWAKHAVGTCPHKSILK